MNGGRDVFAVCDLEVEYTYHLMEYLGKKNNIPFEIRVFTSNDTFLEYAKDHEVKVLLIGEAAMNEEINRQNIGQIIILSEGTVSDELKEYPCIYKYQSSCQIIREVMTNYGEKNIDSCNGMVTGKKKTQLIGIYSPVGRTMKTTFALTLGQIMAKNRAVLYVNMEMYSGFEFLLNKTYEHTLGELLYFMHQGINNIMTKLNGMTETMNNLDYIPPALSPDDLMETDVEEWKEFLTQLSMYSSYEIIILDIGDGITELPEILDQCTSIYVPVRNDPMSQAKLAQFEGVLQVKGKSSVLEKIKKISLPYHRTIRGGAGYLDDLVWSELGDFVRELIRSEGGI